MTSATIPSDRRGGVFASPVAVAVFGFAWVFCYWGASAYKKYDGEMTGHVNVGRRFLEASRDKFWPKVQVQEHSGFDGQFYLYLSCDPFLRKRATVDRLDDPFLRARRIGYPLLVWALTFGIDEPAASAMFAICALSIALTMGMLAASGEEGDKLFLWALLFPLGLPIVMSYHWLTAEPLAMALVAGSMLALRREQIGLAVYAAAAAVLVKEICVIWPAAVAISMFKDGRPRSASLFTATPLPLILWMAWLAWGRGLEIQPGSDLKNLSWPFAGAFMRLFDLVRGGANVHNTSAFAQIALIIALVGSPFIAAKALRRSASPEAIAFAILSLLAICTPRDAQWWDWNNYSRQAFLWCLFAFWLARESAGWKDPVRWPATLSVAAGCAHLAVYFLD